MSRQGDLITAIERGHDVAYLLKKIAPNTPDRGAWHPDPVATGRFFLAASRAARSAEASTKNRAKIAGSRCLAHAMRIGQFPRLKFCP
jgi:hypothetical protein